MQISLQRASSQLDRQFHILGPAPASVSYYEPFSETLATLSGADHLQVLRIENRGLTARLDLSDLPIDVRELHRRLILWALPRYAPSTVVGLHAGLVRVCNAFGSNALLAPFDLGAMRLKLYWDDTLLPWLMDLPLAYRPLKQYFHFLCHFGMGGLSEAHRDFIKSFRGPPGHLYAAVEAGDVFLSPAEQIAIVRHLDDLAFAIGRTDPVDTDVLRSSCILICAFEHAMRPIQISKVVEDDVRIRLSPSFQKGMTVHVRFHMEKQSDPDGKLPMLRRIKPEWGHIFSEYDRRRRAGGGELHSFDSLDHLYFWMGPASVSICIRKISKEILGHPRSANDYRHTAAQRLVDGGASHEELAAFLGQRSTRTGNIYYESSADTVERLNKGLGASPIFSRIENLYRGKSIEPDSLAGRPPDQQVAGAPHGVPIAGIGECGLGQSLCPRNPVLSCYGCVKFIPVHDVKKHEQVRDILRPVVRRFYDASGGDTGSPAYVQLRDTIATIEDVIDDQGSMS